mmetsp:Transcript_91387/g.284809  ORF Transcript_91387/g.284809 Transcript_91387/m.284809 type:complete len:239 (-) Transcript_91387:166-882(-)
MAMPWPTLWQCHWQGPEAGPSAQAQACLRRARLPAFVHAHRGCEPKRPGTVQAAGLHHEGRALVLLRAGGAFLRRDHGACQVLLLFLRRGDGGALVRRAAGARRGLLRRILPRRRSAAPEPQPAAPGAIGVAQAVGSGGVEHEPAAASPASGLRRHKATEVADARAAGPAVAAAPALGLAAAEAGRVPQAVGPRRVKGKPAAARLASTLRRRGPPEVAHPRAARGAAGGAVQRQRARQ